jgi:hypothetical protein
MQVELPNAANKWLKALGMRHKDTSETDVQRKPKFF